MIKRSNVDVSWYDVESSVWRKILQYVYSLVFEMAVVSSSYIVP